MPTVAIVYYSMYGHVRTMAETMKEALEANGCEAKLFQVPETLSEDVLGKMGAPPKSDDPIATPEDLEQADGILFGIPTRFGMAAAQIKAFMDSTGSCWQKQSLANKPAGIFFATGTQNGGQETTALTFVSQLTHHGMIFVPLGYPNPIMFDLKEVHGGSPYGAGTLAGADGSRMPSENEKNVAVSHAEKFATVVKKMSA
ncbi:Minor allergen Alt a 7 [Hondaea fermentalgiana]|uniref:Minor allergen Alt a 7 n=1 Tax=Hondaea fermentalgiana TaxID=2315210 RepID=A0A2R5G8L4_9STRA|nr:Minor allergen Alt a 7 [Hondaea fermentalgiana]|eukprot:GBG27392.1 Minor allergen Alt a 7 [Hondaea fermentalgiana]